MDITAVSEGIKLLALRPGDRLAIMLPDDPSAEEVEDMRVALKGSWPEVVPVFFVGGIELAVVRPDTDA